MVLKYTVYLKSTNMDDVQTQTSHMQTTAKPDKSQHTILLILHSGDP